MKPERRPTSQPKSTDETPSRLADLRRLVEKLVDSDQLLPADGLALLEMVRKAMECLEAGDAAAAGGVLLGFEALVNALVDSGVLDPGESNLCIVQVRAAAAALSQAPS